MEAGTTDEQVKLVDRYYLFQEKCYVGTGAWIRKLIQLDTIGSDQRFSLYIEGDT